MNAPNNGTGGMGKRAAQTAKETDEALAEREARLIHDTSADLERLRPQISDTASFDQLIAAVKLSTASNESIAALQQRVTNLGKGVLGVAKQVAKILA